MKKTIVILSLLLILLLPIASAQWGPQGTIKQVAEDLNYGDSSKNITVAVYYNCTGTRTFNVSFPAGFSLYSTVSTCGLINTSLASCTFSQTSPFNFGSYTFSGSSSVSNHSVTTLPTILSNTTNCAVQNNISMLKIPDNEIFHTLVEYGRGRGNYFYSTAYSGTAGSGHTGLGCPYVPNGTMFELNFLHKIFNVKQYFGSHNSTAENATFTCSYPNRTIVRTHLGDTINIGSTTNISYSISEIEGSWERTAYVGMDFDTHEQSVGDNLTISCDNIQYTLPDQNGNITVYVGGTSFNLQVRDPYPFTASASTTSTVGNGTQEVLITYNITNTEVYDVSGVIIEIDAPPYAQFIGTRSELWGIGRDQYRFERIDLVAGESESISLVARFNTTLTPNASTISLSDGVRVKYVTCWDANAYNPAESVQDIIVTDTATLDLSTPTSIVSLVGQLSQITSILELVNTTTISINNTVNNIESLVTVINTTTQGTNVIVNQINSTVNSILNNTNTILTNTNTIINDTSYIKDQINCNGIVDTPMCGQLDIINSTIENISSLILDINSTLNNITIEVNVSLAGENISINVTPDLGNITNITADIFAELNCTETGVFNISNDPPEAICNRLIRIENNTIIINNSVNEINTLVEYFNSTVFGNVTLQQILGSIQNITVDTTSLLNEIAKNREFGEELIFLITDSFGLQQQAAADFNQGNTAEAAAKLRAANEKLKEATERLIEERDSASSELKTDEITSADIGGGTLWMAVALIGIIGVIVIFISRRDPPEYATR